MRFTAPVDPAQRPLRRRRTVRLLLIDPAGRVLLFRDHDPMLDDFTWWNTPGGGIDHGETPVQAAVREVHEETGLVVRPAEVLGPVATRHVVHGYSDCVVEQEDIFLAIRTPAFEVIPAGLSAAEELMLLEHRWWTPEALRTSGERIWPAQIAALCALVDRTQEWPVLLPDAEESSVPASLGHRTR